MKSNAKQLFFVVFLGIVITHSSYCAEPGAIEVAAILSLHSQKRPILCRDTQELITFHERWAHLGNALCQARIMLQEENPAIQDLNTIYATITVAIGRVEQMPQICDSLWRELLRLQFRKKPEKYNAIYAIIAQEAFKNIPHYINLYKNATRSEAELTITTLRFQGFNFLKPTIYNAHTILNSLQKRIDEINANTFVIC